MQYKSNFPQVKRRLASLYSKEGTDRIFARFDIGQQVITDYAAEYAEKCKEKGYPDIAARAAFWDRYLRQYADLIDDGVPAAYMSELDQGLYAAVTGSKIAFSFDEKTGWISSMSYPLDKQPEEIHPVFDNEGVWYRRYMDQMRVFREASRGKFGVSHFILIDGLNFLFELRGATNTYYDVLENPDFAKRIANFAFSLNVKIQNDYFREIGLYEGGTVSNMAGWVPGRIVSESVDPFHLASPAFFEQWGRENVQMMFDRFDGGVLHLHSNGHHLLESVRSLRGLKAIMLLEESTAPPPWQKVGELNEKAQGVPLVVSIPFDSFIQGMDKRSLPGGVLYHVIGAKSAKQANEAMRQALEYRASKA
ncbi:MAG: hypothetical protein ACOX8S_04490 [Christensenellales bacterium]|jgi:hypothetical protein